MATKDYLPADLLRQMEESGVKFDENGEVIDPDNFLDNEEDQSDDQTDDQQDNTDNEDDSQDESENDDNQSGEESSDEDDLEEDDEPAPKKKAKVASEEKSSRLVLTPKTKDEPEVNTEVMDLRRELSEIKALLAAKKSETPKEDEGDIGATLRKEVDSFRRMRMDNFASTIESEVNSSFPQTSFKDIIASKEWEQYQNSRVMGARVGDMYLTTIRSEEKGDVVSFFTDFVDRYLPSLSKATPIAAAMKKAVKADPNKAKLEDLAVPDKAKAAVSKSKRTGFDFTTSDYAKALDQAERGKMSVAQFAKFEEGFFKAEREGRVKQD
jgi:hypothetical protein